jgi:outer membrane PBP1 activator LpoA protein
MQGICLHRLMTTLRGLCCVSLLALCAACTTTQTEPERPVGIDRTAQRAERLAREGAHEQAAKAYEQAAATASRELRNRFLLRASRQWLLANDPKQANITLAQVSTTLPTIDYVLRAEVAAELALREQKPERALAELDRIPQPPPSDHVTEIQRLRAMALFQMNRPAAAISLAMEREKGLSDAQAIQDNRRMIWQGLQRSAAAGADITVPPGANATLAGWLELSRAALAAARNPLSAGEEVEAWRQRYPGHPANTVLQRDVLPDLDASLEYPSHVALVLPLTGRAAGAAIAVRDGFLTAYFEQVGGTRPTIRLYDSNALGAETAYRQAIAEGAQFVVGPLTKEEVTTVMEGGAVSVPTLALNQVSTGTVTPPLMFQFALNPEEEARQVAQRIIADGRARGVVLVPRNDWGQRVHAALESSLRELGGSVVGVEYYDPSARDFSEPVTRLLLINESRARANSLMTTLGTRMVFEPRARTDVQFIFIGAQPQQGRSIRPALRFHLSRDLPVYSTSDIFEPEGRGNNDIEGVIFPDMPWVISPDSVSTDLRSALQRHWPVRARGRGRLYAFGFDAYRLIPVLKSGTASRPIAGMTGLLTVDSNGRVHRRLDWAQVTDGRARMLASNANTP